MTTKNQKSASDKASSNDLNAWQMACATLSALSQSEMKARQEYDDACNVAAGIGFGAGLGEGALLQTLTEARRSLEADMTQHARSSGLEMPELTR